MRQTVQCKQYTFYLQLLRIASAITVWWVPYKARKNTEGRNDVFSFEKSISVRFSLVE